MNNTKKILVGVHQMFPLVIKEGKFYTGFEIELWEKIANSLLLNFVYREIK